MSTEDKDNSKNDEKYAFIKEQIVPRKKNYVKRIVIITAATIAIAVVFGLVCRIVFEASGPIVQKMLGKKDTGKVIAFPSASPDVENGSSDNTEKTSGEDGKKDTTDNKDNKDSPDKIENSKTVLIEKTIEGNTKDYESIHQELSDTARQVNRSIVTVTSVVKSKDWFNNTAESANSTSGIIIFNNIDNLIILTGTEKLKNTNNIKVTFITGKVVKAKLISADNDTGLAILSVPLEKVNKSTLDRISVATLGESFSLEPGDPIMALGNPNGFAYSMELGIVTSGINYTYITDNKLELFTTNIEDNPNGWGVVCNLKGEVVGVITQKFKTDLYKYVNTVLAISKLKPMITRLSNKTEQAYFGIVGSDLTEGKLKELGVSSGVYISEVQTDSPAFKAGIQSGDIILKIKDSTVSSMNTFYNILSSYKPEQKMKVLIKRKRNSETKQITIKVILSEKK